MDKGAGRSLSAVEKPVLILSMYPEEQYAVRAIGAGASGYLTKNSVSAELAQTIRHVHAGRKFITPTVAERRILIKLGLENTSELIRYGIENGLT